MNDLANLGFSLVYDYPYNHVTTRDEIMNIRRQCTPTTTMCVGGNRVNENSLLLLACANCLNVTTDTIINQPRLSEGTYWYLTDGQSFGFAPNSQISQTSADTTDQSSNLRLSWHLVVANGGWRLGNITYLNDDTTYYKKMYLNQNGTFFKLLHFLVN
jgi:hypothetical protein